MMSTRSSSPSDPAVDPPGARRPVAASSGRPRDRRIDRGVLDATRALLVEVGYTRLSIAAVAQRASTTPPAVYRRWPSKAHLVHEAAFPDDDLVFVPDTDDLPADLTAMVRAAADLFGQPVVLAAAAGLLSEFVADPTLHAPLLERFSGRVWGSMYERIGRAVVSGDARPDVDAANVLEVIGGAALLAAMLRPGGIDEAWVRSTAGIVVAGVAS